MFHTGLKTRLLLYREFLKLKKKCYKEHCLIVIGDSHANFFSGAEEFNYIEIGHDIRYSPQVNGENIISLHLGPGLAYNCSNPSASTGVLKKTEYLIKRFIPKGAKVICCFGEIDIRTRVLKEAEKRNISVSEEIDGIIERYLKYVKYIKECDHEVFCWGPIASQGETAAVDEKFPRYGSMVERNEATHIFNEKLKYACEANGLGFISVFDELVDDRMKTIDTYYAKDHVHLNQKMCPVVKKMLKELQLLEQT